MTLTPTYKLTDLPALDKALVKLQNHDIDKAVYVGFKRAAGSFPGYMARAFRNHRTSARQLIKQQALSVK